MQINLKTMKVRRIEKERKWEKEQNRIKSKTRRLRRGGKTIKGKRKIK